MSDQDPVGGPVCRLAIGGDAPVFETRAPNTSDYGALAYRPDSIVDGWDRGPLSVRAASVRGDAHRLYGVARQDDLNVVWREEPPLLAIAVADGVSASPRSHLGASVACRYAIEYLLRSPAEQTVDWKELMEGCAWAVVETAQRILATPGPEPDTAEREMATTLCVATVTPSSSGAIARAASVGDSGVAIVRSGEIVALLGGKAEQEGGVWSSEVVPLPRVPDAPISGEWALAPGETLLVATDGILDPVGAGDTLVGRLLAEALADSLPDRLDFLRIVDFWRETHDDDRSVVAVRLRAAPAS